MRASMLSLVPLVAIASAQTTGKLGDAAAINNNPAGAAYVATLPNKASTTVRGSVVAISGANGQGVDFAVSFTGLPSEGGPFLYHIHDQPVPADGNCTLTLAHLDPYQRGEDPVCDPTAPQTCQVGDLSGKHGKIPTNSSTFGASYNDAYASLVPGIGAFFGNRSVVVHFANKTRITCANFAPVGSASSCSSVDTSAPSSAPSSGSSSYSTGMTSATASVSGSASSTSAAIVQATTNSAPETLVNSAMVLGGVAVAAMFL